MISAALQEALEVLGLKSFWETYQTLSQEEPQEAAIVGKHLLPMARAEVGSRHERAIAANGNVLFPVTFVQLRLVPAQFEAASQTGSRSSAIIPMASGRRSELACALSQTRADQTRRQK